MKTSETISQVCAHLGVTRAELAKRMGVCPSSFYRKLSRESMTLEELQSCLGVLGVCVEFEIQYPDGSTYNSRTNHELMLKKLAVLESELEAARRTADFGKKSLKDIRTDLNSAVGYAELSGKHGPKASEYLEKLQAVLSNMDVTIAHALGEEPLEMPEGDEIENVEALAGKRVLIVDDNEFNREVLKDVLLDYGLVTEEAENGEDAVAAVSENLPSYFDFILMDLEMPVMDGLEATAKIRGLPNRIRAGVPIIALTVNTSPESREKAFSFKVDDFIPKPVNTVHVLRSLVKLM